MYGKYGSTKRRMFPRLQNCRDCIVIGKTYTFGLMQVFVTCWKKKTSTKLSNCNDEKKMFDWYMSRTSDHIRILVDEISLFYRRSSESTTSFIFINYIIVYILEKKSSKWMHITQHLIKLQQSDNWDHDNYNFNWTFNVYLYYFSNVLTKIFFRSQKYPCIRRCKQTMLKKYYRFPFGFRRCRATRYSMDTKLITIKRCNHVFFGRVTKLVGKCHLFDKSYAIFSCVEFLLL